MISIGHPAQVHLFKNLINKLLDHGHCVKIAARDKEMVLQLLDIYGLEYEIVSFQGKSIVGLALELIRRHFEILKEMRRFKPDLILSGLDPSVAQVSYLLGIPAIVFADNRPSVARFPPIGPMVIPFAKSILTLTSVSLEKYDYGPKAIKLNSYKELAYLHPNYFTPNKEILEEVGISKNEKYILCRFVALKAYHDITAKKSLFNWEKKEKIIKKMENYAKVFISSEGKLPSNLNKYAIPIKYDKIHDLLYYANLLISDSQTMTTEAAVLGTPAIRCNSFVGNNDLGNFIELENKYGLIYNYSDPGLVVEKAIELLTSPSVKEEWIKKRDLMLQDKTDITQFLVWFIENYPDSRQASK